jgi:hypothetical protein
MAAPVIALVQLGAVPPPNPADPSPFAMPDPADIERRLQAAGFSSAHAEPIAFVQRYASLDEYWAETMDLAAPLAAAMAGLSPAETSAVREGAQETLSQFIGADGRIEAPASAVVAVAAAA